MQSYLFIILLVTVAANAKLFATEPQSAASKGQIKFAIDSKYDQTGPGATKPETAYKMYQSLEEALIAYLDDPDTKLPENDKEKAYFKLSLRPVPHFPLSNSLRQYQTSDSKGKYYYILPNNAQRLELPSSQEQIFRQPVAMHNYYHQRPVSHLNYLPIVYQPSKLVPQQPNIILKEPVIHRVPLKHANVPLPFTSLKESESDSLKEVAPAQYQDIYDGSNPGKTNPEYTFSYGVHDRHTGDSKTAHETRDGDTVKGFYTLMDPDGKQRTVHYTADDKHGFKAIVRRTPSNSPA